jgi:hypothetical protein
MLQASLALQVRFGLSPVQLLDRRLEGGRIAKQTDASSYPSSGLEAESGLRLLVAGIRHQPCDRIDRARTFEKRLARVAVRRHATKDVVCPRRCRVVVIRSARRSGSDKNQ